MSVCMLSSGKPDPSQWLEYSKGISYYAWNEEWRVIVIVERILSLHTAGPNTLEPFKEWAWSFFSGILFGVHHHYIMQPMALVSNDFIIIYSTYRKFLTKEDMVWTCRKNILSLIW